MAAVVQQALLMAAVYVPTWQVTYAQALSLDSTGWSGSNMRQYIPSSQLSTSGSAVRFTLQAAAAAGCSIDAMYVGHFAGSGDLWDMAASSPAPAQIKVSGSGSVSISAASSVVTDSITFALDETRDLVVAFHFNTTSSIRGANGVTAVTNYFKVGANETSTPDVSGYSSTTGALRLINKIEVLV